MDDYKKFCLKCGWNDSDYGCTSPPNEEVYQCPLYMYYHPEEVALFEMSFVEFDRKNKEEKNDHSI